MPPTAICPSPPTLTRLARVCDDEADADQREGDTPIDRGGDGVRRADGTVDEGGNGSIRDTPKRRSARGQATLPPARPPRKSQPRGAARRANSLKYWSSHRSLRLSRHHGADPLAFAGVGGAVTHDPAAIEHDDAVRHRNQLVEFGGDQQARRRHARRPHGCGRRQPRRRRHRGRASAAPQAGIEVSAA